MNVQLLHSLQWREMAAFSLLLIMEIFISHTWAIPTTLDGPFMPFTRSFDSSLRRGSNDLPMDHPKLKRNVTGNFPEQIALAASFSPTSLWVSWVTGEAKVGRNLIPLDPASVGSEVWYGKQSGKYTHKVRGNSTVYSQLYPFAGLLNYTSAIIHHVRIHGLEAGTKYYYKCGDSSIAAMSEELVFETMPLPVAVVGDLGLTRNSSSTIDHLTMNEPSLILMVGDLTYASLTFWWWFDWFRFMEPLTSRIPMMVIEGNHEIEPQVSGLTFESYLARFAVPAEESGSNSNFYYSFEAGGIHFIMLGAYIDYNITGAQYAWLQKDLNQVDRNKTPWLVAAWHSPWYNSYSSHYQEFECMRQQMEALLYRHNVDVVFNGHVHAYERMNRVYNYTLDSCGPVYITVGDGGNIEEVDVDHADSQPEWSAVRESSFGHGILEVVNSTYALWTWHRNQENYKDDKLGDQVYIVRQQELCIKSTIPKVKSLNSPRQTGKMTLRREA
ncbi:Purple acid phosphatase 23 [Linum grandiflorum]